MDFCKPVLGGLNGSARSLVYFVSGLGIDEYIPPSALGWDHESGRVNGL